MSAELRELRPGNLERAAKPRGEPNKRIIAMLQRALLRAKSGETQSLVFVEGMDDGAIQHMFQISEDHNAGVIGGLEFVKFAILCDHAEQTAQDED